MMTPPFSIEVQEWSHYSCAAPITQVDYVKINGHINLGLLTRHQPRVLTSDHNRVSQQQELQSENNLNYHSSKKKNRIAARKKKLRKLAQSLCFEFCVLFKLMLTLKGK